MAFKLIILGAAAGGGLPQWNCATSNSGRFWRGCETTLPSSQSAIAVGQPGAWTLLNASPDLRQQIIAQPLLHPTAAPGDSARRSPIESVLLTDGDLDHITGLLTLRERTAFTLLATPTTHNILDANPIFNCLNRDLVARTPVTLETWSAIAGGIRARLFAVPGKVPLYMERADRAPVTDELTESTVGVELTDGQRTALYIPSCAAVTPSLAARLDGADLVLFDGTVFHDDELSRAGVGEKTGRRMGHMPMSGVGGSLEAFRRLSIGRKIFIHINNTNPVWQPDSSERQMVEAAGWDIAHDGLEIEL